jgi:hypothetical protein
MLRTALDMHRMHFAADKRNWGFAGSLGHIEEELVQLVAFIGNGVSENEIRRALDANERRRHD